MKVRTLFTTLFAVLTIAFASAQNTWPIVSAEGIGALTPRTSNTRNTPAIVDATWHGQAWITLRGLPWTPNTIKFTVLVDGEPYPDATNPLTHQLWDLPVGQENAPWITVAWAIDLGYYSVGYHEVSFLCTTYTYGPVGGGPNGGTTDSFGFRYDVNVFNPYSYTSLNSLQNLLKK